MSSQIDEASRKKKELPIDFRSILINEWALLYIRVLSALQQ